MKRREKKELKADGFREEEKIFLSFIKRKTAIIYIFKTKKSTLNITFTKANKTRNH